LSELLSSFVRHLRRQLASRDAAEVSDGDLLRRFALTRDGDAFTALLQRHGPLVLGVCRRVLRHDHDAEDAFQATFLVLARKAGSIGQPERLGNWLFGVAWRTARKARAAAARRRARQQPVTDLPAGPGDREACVEELRQALDDEVRRLPDKFRAPLVLCLWQGLTREEAAARLGWSAGAVKGMLERGRELLRSRLARRGVALSAGSLAALFVGSALSAAVPAVLSDATVKAALLFAAGKANAADSAAALAEGVLRAMFMTQVKWWSAVVLLLGLAGAGAGLLAFGGRLTGGPAAAQAGPPQEAGEKAGQLHRLAAARRDAAKEAYEGYWGRYELGRGPEEAVHLWSRRWLQAQLDLSDKQEERDAALASYQERLKKTDEVARARLVLGNSAVFGPDLRPREGDPAQFKAEGEKFEAARKAYENRQASEEQVCLASVRWVMHQHLARATVRGIDPRAELQSHLGRVKEVEGIAKARFEAGMTARMDYETARFFRLQAEEWLAQGKTFEAKDLDPEAPSK
jgi:RNA polymerase sigma factor (sigma-70 family)